MREIKNYIKKNMKDKSKNEIEDYIYFAYDNTQISEIELYKLYNWLDKRF